jgi:hypothetical protein
LTAHKPERLGMADYPQVVHPPSHLVSEDIDHGKILRRTGRSKRARMRKI